MEMDIKLSQEEYEAAIVAKISSVFPVAPGHEMTLVNTTVGRSNTGLTATIQVLPKGSKPAQRTVEVPVQPTTPAPTAVSVGTVKATTKPEPEASTPVEDTQPVEPEVTTPPVADDSVKTGAVDEPVEEAPAEKPASTSSLFGNLKRP